MSLALQPAKGLLAQLMLLRVERSDPVVRLRLNRPDERNAINGTLGREVASNAPRSNHAITQALPRIAEVAPVEGLFVEPLMSAIAQGDEAAKVGKSA